MSNDPAIDKIKKLLRLGKSSNPHEAELALQRAFEIAEKNHIDLASLDVEDDLKKILKQAHRVGWKMSYSRKQALSIVQTFFNVTPVLSRPNIQFVGTSADIEIAIHVFEFLTRCCNRDLLAARKRAKRRLSRNLMINFVNGFFYGVSANLNTARCEVLAAHDQYSIVLQSEEKRRDLFIDTNMQINKVKLLESGRKNINALMLGHDYGSQIQINSPLPCSSAPLALAARN